MWKQITLTSPEQELVLLVQMLFPHIEKGSSKTKLYASLLARQLSDENPDVLHNWDEELMRSGVMAPMKKPTKKVERVRIEPRDDDDGDAVATRPKVRA